MRFRLLAVVALFTFSACGNRAGDGVDAGSQQREAVSATASRAYDSVLIALQGSWAGAGNPDDVLLIEGNLLLSGSSELTLSDTEQIQILSETVIDGKPVKAKAGELLMVRESNGLKSLDYLTAWGANEFSITSGNNGQPAVYRRVE